MKINKLVQPFALCAVLLLAAFKAMAGYIDTQLDIEPGVWTSDFYGAMAYAQAENIPMLVFWANKGCSHCEGIEREMNKAYFSEWMDDNKLLMVFVESNASVKQWIKNSASARISAYPFIAVYWPRNSKGEMVLEGFSAYKGNMGMYGANSKDSNIQQIIDAIEFLIPDWDPNGVVPDPDPVFYTVNFVVDAAKGNATGALSQQVESGKSAVAPTVAANESWNFTGWDKTFTKVTSDLTVNAQFSAVVPDPDPVFYTVTFVVDEEKGIATGNLTQQVESGKGAVAPAVTANEGWEFTGWDKSFSKVKSDLTVTATFEQSSEREEIDPVVFFKKARTIQAVAYNGDELFGRATITLGKYNAKKQNLKATFKITSFSGKTFAKSLTVTPDKYGDFLGLTVAFKKPVGAMEFDLVNNDGDYEVLGENDDYLVEAGEVEIGGKFESEEVFFSAEMIDDLEPENDNFEFIVDVPSDVGATVRNGATLNFGAAPKLKYNKYREDGETWYELAEVDEDRYPNINAVKISYKPATGVFSGSFNLYASNELSIDDGKKPTLKTYKAKVSGYVVNGVGVGTVSVKVGKRTYVGVCSLE